MMTITRLRRLIQEQVQQAIQPDGAEDDAFGSYLFGSQRNSVDEPNTKREEDVYNAIEQHIVSNNSGPLAKVADDIKHAVSTGAYSQYLAAPMDTDVYRLTQANTPKRCAQILGIGIDELANFEAGTAEEVYSNIPNYQSRKVISSWSLEPEEALAFASEHAVYHDEGYFILLISNTNYGDFILNGEELGQLFADDGDSTTGELVELLSEEAEVVLVGDCQVERAIVFRWDGIEEIEMAASAILELI